MKKNLEELNGWLYRRIRMCIWKQWNLPRVRMRKLIGLGVASHYAATIAYDRKGYWFNAKNKAVNWALNKESRLSQKSLFQQRLPELHFVVVGVDPAFFQQFFVGSPLGDPVVRHHQDLVRVADGGEAVGDGDGGPVFRQLFQTLLDPALALVVQGAGGLVEYEDGRVLQKYARNGDALLLAS